MGQSKSSRVTYFLLLTYSWYSYFCIVLISPKINILLKNPEAMVDTVRKSGISVQHKIGFVLVSEKTLNNSLI